MARRDLSQSDASAHAASELEYIIRSEKAVSEPTVPTLTPEEAMSHERVFKTSSDRDITRVLFISQNTDLLNPTRQSLDGYINISELFDEVHILILRTGIIPKNPVLRAAPNVWIYTAASKYWWRTPAAARKIIDEQLFFANGFRADLIVARDPFESAIVAYKVAEKYSRVTQLHVLDDYTTTGFIKKRKHNFWRRFLPHFTVPNFTSVRTSTSVLQAMLQRKFMIPDVDRLPRFQNYEALIDTKEFIDLKTKYKPVVFTILFVGKLTHASTLYRAIDAARFVLKNPRVAMIVLGDGPSRSEFQKRAKTLEIDRQVIFESKVTDSIPYLKSADLLVITDIDKDSEELVLKGAAAGIPMVMARTETREDIFKHGESAFLCEATDVQSFTDRIDDLLNDIGLREQFVKNSQQIIREKFHNNPDVYREAYRASIEKAFFVEVE